METKDIPGTHTVRAAIGGQATAGTPDSWPLLTAVEDIKIIAVRWIPAATVTGAATNNFALAVQNKGAAGAGTTAVTTTKTYDNTINSVAYASETIPLHATAANRLIAQGEVLALVRTVNNTGLAQPDGLVEVDFQYR